MRRVAIFAIAALAGCHALDSSQSAESQPAAKRSARADTADTGARFGAHAVGRAGQALAIRPAALGPPPAIPGSTQFDILGFLQEAHTTGPTTPGTLVVNGQIVTVPANTVVILPASSMTWDELFTNAPAAYGPGQTGLALFDTPAPLATSEIHVIGNRGSAAASDTYIAGLIYLAQQSLNTGAGFINFIDYDLAEIRVGGTPNDPTTGARVRINDPVLDSVHTGRYSKGLSPDPRFSVDPDNPTIISATGYPMCLPRVAPPGPTGLETDPLCPQGNRPADGPGGTLAMTIHLLPPQDGILPDSRIQAPLEIGDYVSFAGILVADDGVGAGPTAGPWPGLANTYVSAYSIVNNTAIYTAPRSDPAYVEIEVTLIGVGGQNVVGPGGVIGVAEAAARTRFEGMTTDPTRPIHLYAIDLDPVTGTSTDRDLGTIGVDQAGVPGRWRFRPPCLPFPNTADDKNCVMSPAGTFLPPTREVRAVIEGQQARPRVSRPRLPRTG